MRPCNHKLEEPTCGPCGEQGSPTEAYTGQQGKHQLLWFLHVRASLTDLRSGLWGKTLTAQVQFLTSNNPADQPSKHCKDSQTRNDLLTSAGHLPAAICSLLLMAVYPLNTSLVNQCSPTTIQSILAPWTISLLPSTVQQRRDNTCSGGPLRYTTLQAHVALA
jgi:hypothetical protein